MSIYFEFLNEFLYEKVCEHQPPDESLALERVIFKEKGATRARYYSFIEELGLTETEFADTYIHPVKRLSSEQLGELVGYWNMSAGRSNGWLLTLNRRKLYDTLRWLLFRLHLAGVPHLDLYSVDLNDTSLSEFFEKARGRADLYVLGKEHGIPYKQCQYCGQLDKDPRGKEFGKLKVCHEEKCIISKSDVAHHETRCCFRKLYNLRQLTRRHKKEWKKLENHSDDLKVAFFHYLNKRFEEILESDLPPMQPKKTVTHEMEMMLAYQENITIGPNSLEAPSSD
ncbi:MAG: hypothetical protein QE263_00550 [Vampirovibrionales bacterium]|nr:hypothetical protein [Vampirovibrionales bacterium]